MAQTAEPEPNPPDNVGSAHLTCEQNTARPPYAQLRAKRENLSRSWEIFERIERAAWTGVRETHFSSHFSSHCSESSHGTARARAAVTKGSRRRAVAGQSGQCPGEVTPGGPTGARAVPGPDECTGVTFGQRAALFDQQLTNSTAGS